ncbi:MAG: radical SAM protein [Spirochaetes bacterium]|nr:radical SAM protein [Spirochaetota bacterium]MBU0954180.1 radical SAM protein [Spirochaetota bacterium]
MNTNYSIIGKMIRHNPEFSLKAARAFTRMHTATVIDRKFGKGKTKKLALVYFRITPLCNLRCLMCNQRGTNGVLNGAFAAKEAKKIVPVERYYRLVDELAAKDKPMFYMWGGEPFLYPGFMDLAEYITTKKCMLSVNTNGTFLEQNAERIVKNGWHALFVSLDGFRDVNDKIRGDGSYDKVVAGFKAINEAKKKYNSHLPYMGIVTTVSNMNYEYLDQLVAASRDFDLAWHIINLGTYTNKDIIAEQRVFMKDKLDCDIKCLEGFDTGFNAGIDGQKFSEILKKVHALKPGYPIITVPAINPDGITEYYADLAKVVRKECPVPWSQVNFDYNGNVHFCADYPDYIIGNIMDNDFYDIWNGERAAKFRQVLKASPNGLFPGCVRCYQNMLFGKKVKGY